MKNGDVVCLLLIGLFLIAIWSIARRYPAGSSGAAHDRKSPLPSGMYTSGSISNGMDVARRVNFQQQPYGGPTTG